MRRFIVEAVIDTAIALLGCYAALGWAGFIGGLLGCVIGFGVVAIDYRRKHIHGTH